MRWQPWVLLNKPDETEIRERSVYNSALEFSEGAENLNSSVKELSGIASQSGSNPEQSARLKKLLEQISENLQKSADLERKIWADLTDKSKARK